jgi:hypothetical protein
MIIRRCALVASIAFFSQVAVAQVAVDFRSAAARASAAVLMVEVDDSPADQVLPPSLDTIPWRGRPDLRWMPAPMMAPPDQVSSRPIAFAVRDDLVIAGPIRESEVTLRTSEGEEVRGTVVSRDHVTGLVAIRIPRALLTPLPLAEEEPDPGLPVLIALMLERSIPRFEPSIIGSGQLASSSGLGFTHVLSGRFHPRRHGAPVIDVDGRIVGVVAGGAAGDQSQCLSVWHLVKLIRAVSASAAVDNTTVDLYRGRLGIQVGSSPEGPIVGQIMPDTPAEEANLIAGDLILAIDGRRCRTADDVIAAVTMSRAGDEVSLQVRRGEDVLEQALTLAKADPSPTFGSPAAGDPRRGAMPRLFMWQDGNFIPVDPTAPRPDLPPFGRQPFGPQPPDPIFPSDDPTHRPRRPDEPVEENRQREPAAASPDRRNLEEEVDRLEAENENQAATIDQLNEQIAALEAKAKEIIERTNSREIERLEKMVDQIKRQLLEQDRSESAPDSKENP